MRINTIGTHNAEFHADDVIAAAVLLGLFPEANIVRTRNRKVLAETDVVFDVGGEYDPNRGRYDHHQREGAGARKNGVPYAAAGLIWEHFGRDYLRRIFGVEEKHLDGLWQTVDYCLMQGIDAIDNGKVDSSATLKSKRGADQQVNIALMSLSGVISTLNGVVELQDLSDEAQLERFRQAADLARTLLDQTIRQAMLVTLWESRVDEADRGEEILVLDYASPDVRCPWTQFVYDRKHIRFVVFPCPSGGEWRIKAVNVRPGSFEVRKSLPEAWGGKNGTDLDAVTGVEGAVFCHRGLWIGGAKTKDAVLKMAELAVNS